MSTNDKYKVLLAHNHYLERGGEDESFEAEKSLLLENGHEICTYIRSNTEIEKYTWKQKVSFPLKTIYAKDSFQDLSNLISAERPAIAHFNNTFPLISPAAYDACRRLGVPVIQNLRNYRLMCPNALFFRDQHVCEDCLGKLFPMPAIVHSCYRGSRIQSSVVAGMLAYHKVRRTWQTQVDIFVALTEFSRQKFIDGGLPPDKIVVKPNFAYDHGVAENIGDYVLFVGRLVESKGILNLLDAWKYCKNIPLKIVGDGPLFSVIQSRIKEEELENVEMCGRVQQSEVISYVKGARFIVFPSLWYEAFPRVFLESFSCGKPVVASRIGSAPEIIEDERTGYLFSTADSIDLSEKIVRLWDDISLCLLFGNNARQVYEQKYTPDIAYNSTINLYKRAIFQG